MLQKPKITPFLWFDDQAEDAANFYVSIFKDSRVTNISRYGEAGKEVHGKKPGTAMTVVFELEGQPFTALNGVRSSNSAKPSRFRSVVSRRPKSITTGTNCPRAAIRRRSNAPGSKTNSDCHGRSFQPLFRGCFPIPTARSRGA